MAGIAGELIGLGANAQPLIAQSIAVVSGGTSCRGCTTNFIGFGEGIVSTPQHEDFNATDDTVTLGTAIAADLEPVYTGGVLSWAAPVVPPL